MIHTYAPRGAARELMYCKAKEVLISGPMGTGKSKGCLEKLHLQAMKYDGMRGLIARKVAASLTYSVLVEWRQSVAKEALETGLVHFYGGSAAEPAQYRYVNGSSIVLGGMDKSSRIQSTQYDVAYLCEATEFTLDDWEIVNGRLRNGVMPYQQLMGDCNPNSEYHFLYKRCATGATQMLKSRHQDNPLYFNADGTMTRRGREYMERLDNLTGVRRKRLRDGLWVSAEGSVYELFDLGVHLIDRFDIPPEWPRYWSIDFGYGNPFVCQWWAEDPDGRLIRYREIYRTRRTVEAHAKHIMSIVAPGGKWVEPKPQAIITDHDLEGRATLEQYLGMTTTAAHKAVSEGIQAVESRLKVQPDGKPRLVFMKDSLVDRDPTLVEAGKPTCTEEEIPGYVWDGLKEKPVKANDHGCDTTRYMAAHKDLRIPFAMVI